MPKPSLILPVPLLFPKSNFSAASRQPLSVAGFFIYICNKIGHNVNKRCCKLSKYRRGAQSFVLENMPTITTWASIAGKKESEGPLANYFDITQKDNYFGQKTWEQAEQKMQEIAIDTLLKKANLMLSDIQLVFSGDLLNQCIGSSFSLRNKTPPHLRL